MLNKLWQIGIYSLVVIFIAFVISIVIQGSIDLIVSASSIETKAEYGIRKTYDEDAICYTAFMQNGLESGISISCIPRPQICDYQNKKGTQNARTISTETNSYNTE